MLGEFLFTLLLAIVGLGWPLTVSAAPKPTEAAGEKRDKAVKAFVAEAMTALGRHDFDTFVGLCDLPYYMQPSTRVASGIRTTKDGFKEDLANRYARQPKFDGSKHAVRSIRTFKEAKKGLTEQQALDAETVLGEGGLVVNIELDDQPKPSYSRLLIREKDGRFRLVGIQPADEDE